jgi:hypothetical protein
MSSNHSAYLTDCCITSPALADLSPGEIIVGEDRVTRRRGAWRFGLLRFWLAA